MLKQRIITGLVLAPLVIAGIYLLPLGGFAVFIGVIAGLAAYEWAGLASIEAPPAKMAYVAGFVALALCGWFWSPLMVGFVLAAGVTWLLAIIIVLFHPKANGLIRSPWAVGILGWLVTLGAWAALVFLRSRPDDGAHAVLFVLLICWAADIGAYFCGKQFGQRKLAPSVSPGKTWEGAVGGLATALLVCSAWWLVAHPWIWALPLVIVALVAISVIGDLFESVLKRQSDLKDSGSLLPGHGGVLDRADSVLAVAPVVMFVLLLSDMASELIAR